MNRIVAFFNSITFAEFQQLDFNSRNKMQKLAWASLLPIMLYAAIGFGLVYSMFNLSKATGAVAACIAIGVIFIIEKIVMAQGGNWYLALLRIGLVVIMSILGSYLVDSIIFSSEINEVLADKQHATMQQHQEALYAEDPELQALTEKAQKIESKIAASFASFSMEMHGADGRLKGYGDRAKTHETREARFEAQLAMVEQQIQARREALTTQAKSMSEQQADGILARMNALKLFMADKPFTKLVFWLILLFLVLLESMVINIKMSETTPFEHAYATRNHRAAYLAEQRKQYLKTP
jgi:hypothetical protein